MARGWHDEPDLAAQIKDLGPDLLLVDVNAYGARTVAETSGLPWATLLPSVVPVPGEGIPPYGVGLKPARGPLGAVRDRVGWKVVERMFGKAMLPGLNALRVDHGLPPLRSPLTIFEPPYQIIATTAEPLEYPRTDLPANVHLVGAQPWDVPSERPGVPRRAPWRFYPWVLVTCSTEYQGDDELARAAVEALAAEPVRVLVTMADAFDSARIPTAANVRVERFVPHGHVVPGGGSCRVSRRHGHRHPGRLGGSADGRGALRSRPARDRTPGDRVQGGGLTQAKGAHPAEAARRRTPRDVHECGRASGRGQARPGRSARPVRGRGGESRLSSTTADR